MKKMIIGLFVMLLAGMLVACGSQQGNSSEGNVPETNAGQGTQQEIQTDDESEGEPIDCTWYTENNNAICDGVYFVGNDIAPGSYILSCTDSSWAMEITVFESEQNYFNYHKTSRFTVGEEGDAKSQNALINTIIWPEETYSLNIQDGYVLKIESGKGTLVLAEGGAEPSASSAGKTRKVMDGLYLSKDITRGAYMITCTETDYAMQVLIFKDKAAYDDYTKADQFTVGEAQSAIEQHAMSDFYIYQGDSAYVNLTDDMIVLVDGGEGVMEPVAMSWAG